MNLSITKPSGAVAKVESYESIKIELPDEPTLASTRFEDYTWLIYGAKKIGKTSLVSQFNRPLFLLFEPGGKGLDLMSLSVPDWNHFLAIKAMLKKTPGKYNTVVFDTSDIAYDRAFAHYCKELGIDHPTDIGYGKGWDAIKKGFRTEILDLANIPDLGIVFISHATEAEFIKIGGEKHTKIIPSLQNSPREFFSGFVDIIGCYIYYGDERFLTISGNEAMEGGQRAKKHFWVKGHEWDSDDPIRVHSIPMGDTEEIAYANVLKAWHNKQETAGRPQDSKGRDEDYGIGEKRVGIVPKK